MLRGFAWSYYLAASKVSSELLSLLYILICVLAKLRLKLISFCKVLILLGMALILLGPLRVPGIRPSELFVTLAEVDPVLFAFLGTI